MSDIVKRLRKRSSKVCAEAAEEIELLRVESLALHRLVALVLPPKKFLKTFTTREPACGGKLPPLKVKLPK